MDSLSGLFVGAQPAPSGKPKKNSFTKTPKGLPGVSMPRGKNPFTKAKRAIAKKAMRDAI